MTTPTVTETRRAGRTNERVELARYTVSANERIVHGKHVLGVVRSSTTPRPATAATTSSSAS